MQGHLSENKRPSIELKVVGQDKTLLERIDPKVKSFIQRVADSTVYLVPRRDVKYGYVGRGMEERPFDIYLGAKSLESDLEFNSTILHEAFHQIEHRKWNTPLSQKIHNEWRRLDLLNKTPNEYKEMGFTDPLWRFRVSVVGSIYKGEFLAESVEEYYVYPKKLKEDYRPVFDFFNQFLKFYPSSAEKGHLTH